MTQKLNRADVLTAITQYYEDGDLSFIETLNNITYGYKVEMKRNLTQPNHEQRKQ
jgi:hypothetical protein